MIFACSPIQQKNPCFPTVLSMYQAPILNKAPDESEEGIVIRCIKTIHSNIMIICDNCFIQVCSKYC